MTAPPARPGTPGAAPDEPPPFWGRWSRIYLLIAGLLFVEILAFFWLTRWAS